jgi:hypothetical protein
LSVERPAAEREDEAAFCGRAASDLLLLPPAGLVATFGDRVVTALAGVLFFTEADEGTLFLEDELAVFAVFAVAATAGTDSVTAAMPKANPEKARRKKIERFMGVTLPSRIGRNRIGSVPTASRDLEENPVSISTWSRIQI